jgi:tRNA (guanine37-N1)-methyltransferase
MKLCVLTLFPELFKPFWNHGIIRRAVLGKKIEPTTLQIRDYAEGRHRVTDDRPYGGGCGMVMKPEPLASAVEAAKKAAPEAVTLLLSPQGKRLDQHLAEFLAAEKGMILICGRYEGVDERFVEKYVDGEISIGDFVLTGGELAAMVVIDSVVRLLPDVLGNQGSAKEDTFSDGLVEYPQYTRPPIFEQSAVPEVLLSGNHREIDRWRRETALIRTLLKRPDLLVERDFTQDERGLLTKWREDLDRLIG